jgi:copper(I)-binding protein
MESQRLTIDVPILPPTPPDNGVHPELGQAIAGTGDCPSINLWAASTQPATTEHDPILISGFLLNLGEKDVVLVSAFTDVATAVIVKPPMAHDVDMVASEAGKMLVEAGTALAFGPEDYHLMLSDLQFDLMEGDKFVLALHFQNAGEMVVMVKVVADGKKMEIDEHDMESMQQ